MSESFVEIVRNDKSLLALLKNVDYRSSIGKSIFADIDDICVKIAAIETTNPKCYSRRIAWTITGCLLLNLTTHYNFQVVILLEESQRLKQNFTRQSFIFASSQATKRKNTKQVTRQARGGKKRRTVANEDDDDDDGQDEMNEQTIFSRERFWEVPLTFETNINLTKDSCLVPADQITLRERDFDEPSQIDDTFDEMYDDFGDDGQPFGFDLDEPMGEITGFDENMNISMDISDIDNEPIQSLHEDTTAASSTHHKNDNGNTTALLSDLSSLPPVSIAPRKKKSTINKRRTTLLLDEENEIPNKIMKKRISNVFVSCKNREKLKSRMSNHFKPRTSDFFTVPAIKGLYNGEQFDRGARTRPMPIDWTILNDIIDLSDRASGESSEASDILQSEHGGQFNRTRNQSRMSFNELSFNELTPQFTSTPIRPSSRQSIRSPSVRSVSRASHSNLPNLFTPPSAFQNSASQNLPSQPAPPPIEYGDDDDGLNICFNQNNSELQSVRSGGSSRQRTIGNTTINEEIDESESDDAAATVEYTDLMNKLGKDSSEYKIVTKLIRLWQKNVHPIKVHHLLKKGCNRFQAAKTFSSLLILKKKSLVQMDNSDDGKITHISPGPEMTLPV